MECTGTPLGLSILARCNPHRHLFQRVRTCQETQIRSHIGYYTSAETASQSTQSRSKRQVRDALVLVGWNPGEGRSLPPMTHAEFKKAWTTWINNGAYAPKP